MRVSDDWLTNYTKRTGKKVTAAPRKKKTNVLGELEKQIKAAKPYVSPHKKALDELERKPELFDGNQEHYEQVRIFWHYEQNSPAIYLRLSATPNGGYRGKKAGGKMKAEGQKKGYPDMTLDMPRGRYAGMRIELKVGRNSLTEEQIVYLRQLAADGYHCVYCHGMHEVLEAIAAYWHLEAGELLPVRERDLKWAA